MTKIEWTDESWNPITGCSNDCGWCYAKKFTKRLAGRFGYPKTKPFKPTFHKDKLDKPYHWKKPRKVFVDSMGDFFDKGVKREWQEKVLKVIEDNQRHTFQILTKVPENIPQDIKFPQNLWIGVSITKFEDRQRIITLISMVKKEQHTFVSIEPCLDDYVSDYVYLCDWIIVGGLTGKKKPFRPKNETIENLIFDCKRLKKPLFIKDNLGYSKKIQEFPK